MKVSIVKIAVHRDVESPVYGENAITIELDDEGGGMFFVIAQGENRIRIELEELKKLTSAGEKILSQFEKFS